MVRHGQASFGAADYDQLSPLGVQQCSALGAHWAALGLRPDVVLRGSLRRHEQSWLALQSGFGSALPAAQVFEALNEYDSEALIAALPPVDLPDPHSAEGFKAHFRRLRDALAAWMAGEVHPRAMPTYCEFRAGVEDLMARLRQEHLGRTVVVVSSGGPISTAVASTLGTPAQVAIDLNMRMRNSAVSEWTFTASRHQLLSFNGLAHLQVPERQDWITYA